MNPSGFYVDPQLAAPFVGKCHLFYYDVWNKRNEKNGFFIRTAGFKKKR